MSVGPGFSEPVPGFRTFEASPLGRVSASEGAAATSAGAGISPAFGAAGAAAGFEVAWLAGAAFLAAAAGFLSAVSFFSLGQPIRPTAIIHETIFFMPRTLALADPYYQAEMYRFVDQKKLDPQPNVVVVRTELDGH